MKKYRVFSTALLLLTTVFAVIACKGDTIKSISAVTFFEDGGSNLVYSSSYLAGLNYAKTSLNHELSPVSITYQNVDANFSTYDYKNIDVILGTFNNDVKNSGQRLKLQIPLISSEITQKGYEYQAETAYFPLDQQISVEVEAFASLIEEDVVIYHSSEAYFVEYTNLLMDKLQTLGKKYSQYALDNNFSSYQKIAEHISAFSQGRVVLVTDTRAYSGILHALSEINYQDPIFLPHYLGTLGSLPPSIKFDIKFLSYEYNGLDYTELLLSFNSASFVNNDVKSFSFFVNGYRAYELLFRSMVQTNKERFTRKELTYLIYKEYSTISFNAFFADVIA